MQIDNTLKAAQLKTACDRVFTTAITKIRAIERSWDPAKGTPVFTTDGIYTTRGWTEWTQGFQYGCALLAFDGTGDQAMLALGRRHTLDDMAPHLTHIGVHDHGFNNLSTYGNLRRLMREGRIPKDAWEMHFYELAIKASAAVQAARWADVEQGQCFIYSFHGPQSPGSRPKRVSSATDAPVA